MELLIILLLILLNGVFSMSEIAIVSSRKVRLQAAAKVGKRGAETALNLSTAPEQFLSTVQFGITLIGLLTGIYSGETITNKLEDYLSGFTVLRPIADGLSVTVVLLITTFFTVILGELVPKRIGLANPEGISLKMARPMKVLSTIAYPFVWFFTRTSDFVFRLLNLKPSKDSNITEEEIKEVIQEATATGEIEEIEQDIVERVFLLGDRKISSLMSPRRDLIYIDVDDDLQGIRDTVRDNLHRVYPVFEKERDNIIGTVSLKDLFVASEGEAPDLRTYLVPAHYLSENTSVYVALERFKDIRMNYALVFNEYGVVVGMVTVDDILLALVGHASDFQDDDHEMKETSDGSWLVDGQYPLPEFMLNLDLPAEPGHHRILTVAGLLLKLFNRMPRTGDSVLWNGLRLVVVDMDNAKIDKVLVKREDPAPV